MAETRDPWDWDPILDSPDNWSLFQYFLRIPAPRSFQVVAAAFGRSYAHIRKLAIAGNWKERALAFDRHIIGELLAEHAASTAEETRKTQAAHLRLLRLTRATVEREIEKLHSESQSSPAARLSARELTRLLDVTIKDERLVLGQATEIPGRELDLGKLSQQELDELDRLTTKARPT